MAVRGQNWREQRYAIAGGAALNPAVRFRREVDFAISDPMGNASYAILTGPGPTNTTGDIVYPFSMKLLSPRLQRSAQMCIRDRSFTSQFDGAGLTAVLKCAGIAIGLRQIQFLWRCV